MSDQSPRDNEVQAPATSKQTGNRCGHNPDSPQWDKIVTPEVRGTLPVILGDMVDNAIAYYADPLSLRPLAAVMNGKEKGKRTKYRGTNNDGTVRKSRSEAREAEVLVMVSILLHMDVTSLRVGTPRKGDAFSHRTCKELAARVSLIDPKTKKPNRRFQRAFTRLQEAGLLNMTRVGTQDKNGRIIQTAAVKSVTEDFAVLLLGGTTADRTRLKRHRDRHSALTRDKRKKPPVSTKPLERDALARQIDANNRTRTAAADISKATGFKVTGEEYASMYAMAREAHQRGLMAQGADFKQMHEAMKQFPQLGVWRP